MAAANTDKLKKYKSLYSSTLSTGISTGTSDTITPASVVGLPTDTAVTLTIDRVDSSGVATPSKMERITGVISGGNLTSYVRGIDGTTEQAHSAGAVIEMILNADDWNDMVDWGIVEHNQDGTHKVALVTTLKASGAVVNTGTSDVTIVTPKALADSDYSTATDITDAVNKKAVIIQVVDGATDLATGDGKAYFTVPSYLNGFILKAVHARVITAGTTNTTDIQIRNVTDTVDMLSTKITIDSGETGSDSAATAAVIDTTKDDVATNDLIAIDVDAVSTTAPKGLVVRLELEDN